MLCIPLVLCAIGAVVLTFIGLKDELDRFWTVVSMVLITPFTAAIGALFGATAVTMFRCILELFRHFAELM